MNHTFRIASLAIVTALARTSSAQAPEVLYRFDGDRTNAQLGFSVASVGDVDGDGFADVVAGAMSDDSTLHPQTGSLRMFSGATGAVLWTIYGDATGDRLGWVVQGLGGDVTGDGSPDVLVGAYKNDFGGADAGLARIYDGASGARIRTFLGEDDGDFFGYSVAGTGDVTGDGVVDLAVGAWQDETNGANSGSVYVFSGSDWSLVRKLSGSGAGARFGYTLRGVGDLDHDGRGDLVVGSPGARLAEVYSGLDGSVIRSWSGTIPDDSFGFTTNTAGDIDGDGTPDVMIGAFKAWSNRGYADIYSGATSALLHHVEGDAIEDWFSVGMCGIGDLDGDGFSEFSVTGFRNNTNGHESGLTRVYSGRNTAVLATYIGDSGNDWFGYALAGPGDVDGDGLGDLAIGTNQDNHNGLLSGSVTIVSGAGIATATPFCFGDGSGNACPCANEAPAGSRAGCGGSLGTGGMLAGSGRASVANDGFALAVSGLPSSAFVLFFQADNQVAGGLGAIFGDGLRCASGGSIRLATRSCLNGHARLPGLGDTPISTLGSIATSGGQKHYQAWYRNPLGPCGSGYNLTNAVTALWSP